MQTSEGILSVTVDGADQATIDDVLAKLRPFTKGDVERTRDFGATVAIATAVVTLAKALVDLWQSVKADTSRTAAKPAAAVTIEARDGAVLSLPEVHDAAEIERFVAEHASAGG